MDTGQNRIQLYTYLGYNNQRWRVERQEDDTVTILSVHDGRAIAVRADGMGLEMNEPDAGSDRQRWRLGPEAKGDNQIRGELPLPAALFFGDYNRWFGDGGTNSCRDAGRDKRVTLRDEYDTLEELLD